MLIFHLSHQEAEGAVVAFPFMWRPKQVIFHEL